MGGNRRPLAVAIIACLYIAVGAIGFVAHFGGFDKGRLDWFEVESVEVLAVVAGVFLWRGQDWARWLAVAWMAFHVAISFPDAMKAIIHSVFLAVIAWFLFRADARRYFRGEESE